jgi:hypothetical protein
MDQYEIQMQFYENNDSLWASLVNSENSPIFIFISEEAAEKALEKLQLENPTRCCRIIKKA